MKITNGFFILGTAILLSSCVSGYSEFYKGATPEQVATFKQAAWGKNLPVKEPFVVRIAKAEKGWDIPYLKKGYSQIGYSAFNSGRKEPEENAIEQGRKLGADLIVIADSHYTGSITGGGTVVDTRSGPTSVATVIPYTVHRQDYGAAYFVKTPVVFGVFLRDLNDEERQAIQSNKGAFVIVVIDDSPAYQADILPGDIIFEINEQAIGNAESAKAEYNKYLGQTITVLLYRQGKPVKKTVQLLDKPKQ
jgi:hypothetical protein